VIRTKSQFCFTAGPGPRTGSRSGLESGVRTSGVFFFGGEFCDVAKSGYPKEDFGQLWATS
jgi:hypothetical protein